MVRVVVVGAAGKMGKIIAGLALGVYPGLRVVGAVEVPGHEAIGEDIGLLLGLGATGVVVVDDLRKVIDGADAVIDFTSSSSTKENLKIVAEAGRPMVIGTTGFYKEELAEIGPLLKSIPCVMASNMSLGVNLLLKVLADIASALGDEYDVEIIEAHHRQKKDAPSGTAMMMARVLAAAVNRNLEEVVVYARQGVIGARKPKEIGIQTIRAGDIVGEHTVIFGGLGERIEITHRVSSRETFARGALKAALWLVGRPAGLYDMRDVLGLK